METRPASKLELWSIYRANHGIYKNVLVAMKYVPKHSIALPHFHKLVVRALRERLLEEQPLLSCVVEDATSDTPCFKRTQFAEMPIEVLEGCTDMEDFFRKEHERGPTNDRLWRVTLTPIDSAFWVSFAFHHAIGDGTSGLIFHEVLLKALQELTDSSSLSATVRRALPPSIEQTGLTLPIPWTTLAKSFASRLPMPGFLRTYFSEPPFYGGRKTSIHDRLQRRTYLTSFTLSAAQVANLRRIAKSNAISIHALLHGAAVHSIDTNLPIKTSTPINLRPSLPVGVQEARVIANYACAHSSISPLLRDPLCTSRAYYAELNAPGARTRARDGIAALQWIDNACTKEGVPGVERVILDRLHTPSDHCLTYTLEISNLGNVRHTNRVYLKGTD